MNLTVKQREDIKRNFKHLLPEAEISFDTYNKNNTEDTGISFKFNDRGGPIIYINDYPELVSEKINLTYHKVAEMVKERASVPFDISILTPEYCVEHAILQTVNKENPIFKTAQKVCEDNDYAGLLRIEITLETGEEGTIVVHRQLVDSLHLDVNQMLEKAKEKIRSTVFHERIDNVIFAMMNTTPEEDYSDINMHVLMVESMVYGASILFVPDVIGELANDLESDLFILPSSTHELIAIPATDAVSNDTVLWLKEIVKTINATEVQTTDKLTDNVYRYSHSTNKITIA